MLHHEMKSCLLPPAWPGLSWLMNCTTSYQVFYTCLHLPTTCTGPHSRRNCFLLLLSHGNSILAGHWYLPSWQVSFLNLFFAWLKTLPTSSPPLKWHLLGYVYVVCILKTNRLESWFHHLLCDWHKFLRLFQLLFLYLETGTMLLTLVDVCGH